MLPPHWAPKAFFPHITTLKEVKIYYSTRGSQFNIKSWIAETGLLSLVLNAMAAIFILCCIFANDKTFLQFFHTGALNSAHILTHCNMSNFEPKLLNKCNRHKDLKIYWPLRMFPADSHSQSAMMGWIGHGISSKLPWTSMDFKCLCFLHWVIHSYPDFTILNFVSVCKGMVTGLSSSVQTFCHRL